MYMCAGKTFELRLRTFSFRVFSALRIGPTSEPQGQSKKLKKLNKWHATRGNPLPLVLASCFFGHAFGWHFNYQTSEQHQQCTIADHMALEHMEIDFLPNKPEGDGLQELPQQVQTLEYTRLQEFKLIRRINDNSQSQHQTTHHFIGLHLLQRHLRLLPLPANARYESHHHTAQCSRRGVANRTAAHYSNGASQNSQHKSQTICVDLGGNIMKIKNK